MCFAPFMWCRHDRSGARPARTLSGMVDRYWCERRICCLTLGLLLVAGSRSDRLPDKPTGTHVWGYSGEPFSIPLPQIWFDGHHGRQWACVPMLMPFAAPDGNSEWLHQIYGLAVHFTSELTCSDPPAPKKVHFFSAQKVSLRPQRAPDEPLESHCL